MTLPLSSKRGQYFSVGMIVTWTSCQEHFSSRLMWRWIMLTPGYPFHARSKSDNESIRQKEDSLRRCRSTTNTCRGLDNPSARGCSQTLGALTQEIQQCCKRAQVIAAGRSFLLYFGAQSPDIWNTKCSKQAVNLCMITSSWYNIVLSFIMQIINTTKTPDCFNF